jgi:hypothetical protein
MLLFSQHFSDRNMKERTIAGILTGVLYIVVSVSILLVLFSINPVYGDPPSSYSWFAQCYFGLSILGAIFFGLWVSRNKKWMILTSLIIGGLLLISGIMVTIIGF